MSSRKAPPFIYLASQSPRRTDILKQLGLTFQTVPSSYEEKFSQKSRERPSRTVLRHAEGKARQARLPTLKHTRMELVLGADTLVYFQGRSLGKPKSYAAAERVLMQMSGKTHRVYTGIAVLERKTGRLFKTYEITRVRFHRWDRQQIRGYVKTIHALDKAGAYAIQMKPCIVSAYEGSLSNVIGLPKQALGKLLRKTARMSKQTFKSR